ncbi:MAG TPA: type I 3-dehydroquinate dehydratase [Phycisphaerae bacterium]|nr:type I 3-dehydroquinate dehydratase [Phycisphaerae bacterium]
MTKICVPVFVKGGVDVEEAIARAEEALEGVEGMVELRCDTASVKGMLGAIDVARVPVIVTVRPTWEGGFSQKSDAERIGLWEAAMEAGAEYVDVELEAWEKSGAIREAIGDAAEKNGTRLIVSNHCFGGRPKDLAERVGRLRAVREARVLKMAWKAESLVDAIDALRMVAENRNVDGRPLVALAMGEEGLISRVLAKKFGAPFTFGVAERGKESAPGQPTVAELRERFRWEAQGERTGVCGVVGWPVGHSLSPDIHNAGFAAVGADAVYVPLAVRPGAEAFTGAVEALRGCGGMNLRGLSVTIPHKESAMAYAEKHGAEVDALSRHIGVVNTLVWRGERGGGLKALNSDLGGALDALVGAWGGTRESLRGKRVAVLGAGGAGRAIVAGLAAAGATVVVYNRTLEKGQALAEAFGGTEGKVVAAAWEKLGQSCCEAYINCTPVGMHPHVNETPMEPITSGPCAWGAGTVVFDTVYNPAMTKFLKLSRQAGATIVPGTEMFVRQAAVQFEEFTGKAAPVEAFRRVMGAVMKGR